MESGARLLVSLRYGCMGQKQILCAAWVRADRISLAFEKWTVH